MSDFNLYLSQPEVEKIFKDHLKITTYTMSIKSLFGERLLRKIDSEPYYQRNYVWDRAKASFFIESILLGTDVPPLIFFNSGDTIEVIDGKQRFETIKRFKQNDLSLSIEGLDKLPQLKNKTINSIGDDIQEKFDNSKIRIFEFEVINKPQMNSILEDKIKKEIFRRYNSGITPLNTAEIDNASYDDDQITNKLKLILLEDKELLEDIRKCFLGKAAQKDESNLVNTLQFLRRYLVLISFPISTYATGNNRTEILKLLFDVISDNEENVDELCSNFIKNIKLVISIFKLTKDQQVSQIRFVYECILWAVSIVAKEKNLTALNLTENEKLKIILHYTKNIKIYNKEKSFYYRSVIDRFTDTAKLFNDMFEINFNQYIRHDNFSSKVNQLRQSEKEVKLKISELESLRVNKPDPSLVPIDEIIHELCTQRYLVRPSYQRQERINIPKASAIIESILLGINLPPIFIFKNKDNVREIVDGQQRLLSILGYIGKQYMDENGKLASSKNNYFRLSKLKILKELSGKNYAELNNQQKDKILDFKLQVIEIDFSINPNFDPVDLFIRLNNKPYPIKENSFEMWNSFVDRDVIKEIKVITDLHVEWFFIKTREEGKDCDRMLNEELITMLCYIYYNKFYRKDYNSLDIYARDSKINCRIKDKKDITNLLEELSINTLKKENFTKCITQVSNFIEVVSQILKDTESKKIALNQLFNIDKDKTLYRRTLTDFYMLFTLLCDYNPEKLEILTFDNIKSDLAIIQGFLRNVENVSINDEYVQKFESKLKDLVGKYS